MRYFFRFELEHLLARSGFEVTALYGGFDRSPSSKEHARLGQARVHSRAGGLAA